MNDERKPYNTPELKELDLRLEELETQKRIAKALETIASVLDDGKVAITTVQNDWLEVQGSFSRE